MLSDRLNDCFFEGLIAENKWISKKDKIGKAYHINIDEEENKNNEEIKKLLMI